MRHLVGDGLRGQLKRPILCGLAAVMALGACAPGGGESLPTEGASLRLSLTPATAAVFVGERASLMPVFDGDRASIDGIGRVQSGVAVVTPPLSRATTFTLLVDRGDQQVEARTTVQASYRNRIRVLHGAAVAQTNHLAAALPDGRAIVMGGNTSESPLVPDSTLTQIFDPATEEFAPGPDLLFSVEDRLFTSVAPLQTGGFLLVGSGPNAPVGALRSVVTQLFDPAVPGLTPVASLSFHLVAVSFECQRGLLRSFRDGSRSARCQLP